MRSHQRDKTDFRSARGSGKIMPITPQTDDTDCGILLTPTTHCSWWRCQRCSRPLWCESTWRCVRKMKISRVFY